MKNFKNECILDLCDIRYSSYGDIGAFYADYRSSISRHLKKRGDSVDFLQDRELAEDEVLSPTFEEMIVLWCLEKIDPRLPNRIKAAFGEKLNGVSTLRGLRLEIFKVFSEFDGKDKPCGDSEQVKKEDDSVSDHGYDAVKNEPDHEDGEVVLEVELEAGDREPEVSEDWDEEESFDPNEVPEDTATESTDSVRTCSICQKTFKSHKNLKLHMKHHNSEPSACKDCGKTFKNKDRLSYHHRLVHKVEPCSCSECGAAFQTRLNLYNHMRKHKVDPCVCEFCNSTFKNRTQLCNHKYTAHYLKAMRCKICDLQLTSQSMYVEHVESHKAKYVSSTQKSEQNGVKEPDGVSEKQVNSVVRTASDVVPGDLSGENDLHDLFKQEIKTYPCEMCGKMFNGYNSLKNHQLLQHEQKLECGFCKEEFISSKLLFIHREKVHNISKSKEKIPCEVCGKFVVPCSMRKHMNIHRDSSSKLECDTCKRKFKSEAEMGSHICKHFSCDECDQKFIQNRNLQAHKLEHQGIVMYHCDRCEAMFQKVKLLGTHKRFVHQGIRRYACTLCDKKFAASSGLKDHIRVHHTGEKPFKCEECGTAFKSRSGLHSHMRLHKNEFPLECEVCQKKFRNTGQIKRHRESKLCGVSHQDLFRNNINE